MLFELREEKVKHCSTGAVEVTERRIVAYNETEIDSRFIDIEVGHRRNLKEGDCLDCEVIYSIVRIK